MTASPYALQTYSDLLGELEHARRVLAQARIGSLAPAAAAQRAIEAIDAVEASWSAFGRQHLRAARAALLRLRQGELPCTPECIEAVRELSGLLQAHRRADHAPSCSRHYAWQ